MINIYCWYISWFDTGFFVDGVWQVLRFIMVFYFELRQNCAIFYFRHKKSPSIIRKDLILKIFVVGRARFERATIALKVPDLLL